VLVQTKRRPAAGGRPPGVNADGEPEEHDVLGAVHEAEAGELADDLPIEAQLEAIGLMKAPTPGDEALLHPFKDQ